MLDALLIGLIAYLGLVYAFGLYLAARAMFGRRLRQVLCGAGPRRVVRDIRAPRRRPTPPTPAEAALDVPQRLAA